MIKNFSTQFNCSTCSRDDVADTFVYIIREDKRKKKQIFLRLICVKFVVGTRLLSVRLFQNSKTDLFNVHIVISDHNCLTLGPNTRKTVTDVES